MSLRAKRSNPENLDWIAASDTTCLPRNDAVYHFLREGGPCGIV
jgi:hypothetical protein